MAANREIHDLPRLEFAGLPPVPCGEVESSWENRLAAREYYDVPGAAHDDTGRGPITSRVTLYFVNTFEAGLYPGAWVKWRKALLSGALEKFRHPDIGIYNARVADGSLKISPASQAGVIVSATFVESIKSPEQPTKIKESAGAAKKAAAAADKYMAALSIDYPDGMIDPSFEEAIAGFTGQFTLTALEFSGKVANLVGTIDRVKENLRMQSELIRGSEDRVVDAVAGSVERILLELELDTLRWALRQAEEAAIGAARPVLKAVTSAPTDFATLSLSLGADLASILDLNPALLALPTIPAGTSVRYFGLV